MYNKLFSRAAFLLSQKLQRSAHISIFIACVSSLYSLQKENVNGEKWNRLLRPRCYNLTLTSDIMQVKSSTAFAHRDLENVISSYASCMILSNWHSKNTVQTYTGGFYIHIEYIQSFHEYLWRDWYVRCCRYCKTDDRTLVMTFKKKSYFIS